MNNYLEQIRTYIDAHPIKAERCLNLSEIKSGQLHHIKNNNPELADVFFLILGNYGDHYRVVPGSLDGLMGGENDIILPEDVMGDYTFISLDLVKILPASAIGSGFARLDNESFSRINASLDEFETGVPGNIRSYSFAIPYASDEDPMAVYHESIRAMINEASSIKQTIMFRTEHAPLLFPAQQVSLAAAGEEKNPYAECHVKGYDNIVISVEYNKKDSVLRITCFDDANDDDYFTGFDSWQIADQTGTVFGGIADGKAVIQNFTNWDNAVICLIDPKQNIYVLTTDKQ